MLHHHKLHLLRVSFFSPSVLLVTRKRLEDVIANPAENSDPPLHALIARMEIMTNPLNPFINSSNHQLAALFDGFYACKGYSEFHCTSVLYMETISKFLQRLSPPQISKILDFLEEEIVLDFLEEELEYRRNNTSLEIVRYLPSSCPDGQLTIFRTLFTA